MVVGQKGYKLSAFGVILFSYTDRDSHGHNFQLVDMLYPILRNLSDLNIFLLL